MSALQHPPALGEASPPMPLQHSHRPPGWFRLLGVVIGLELAQRVRSTSWYVLLGIVALVVGGVMVVLWLALQEFPVDIGGVIFSTTVFLVLLVITLVTPALSGSSINGERDSGTLASTQVTQVTAGQLVLGKIVACWIASLGFLAVCVPFMLGAALLNGIRPAVLLSLPILVLEIGVVSAIGVGLSALIRKPVLSTAATYLVVAIFSIGTLIAFGVATLAFPSVESRSQITWDYDASGNATCRDDGPTYTESVPRPDRVWWLLAANPYVIISDAIPPEDEGAGGGGDLFGMIAYGTRAAQVPPVAESCADYADVPPFADPYEDLYAKTTPSWFVGMAIHIGVAALATWGAIAVTRTPARTLARGSRIA